MLDLIVGTSGDDRAIVLEEGENVLEPGAALDERERQSEQGPEPVVRDHHRAGAREGADPEAHMVEGRLQVMRLPIDELVLLGPARPDDPGDLGLEDDHVVGTRALEVDLEPRIAGKLEHEGHDPGRFWPAPSAVQMLAHAVVSCRQIDAAGHGIEIFLDADAREDVLGDVRQELAELVVADLELAFGEEGEAAIHDRKSVREIFLGALAVASQFGQLIRGAFEVARLGPDLSLQRNRRLERGIGRAADLVLPAGAAQEGVDDPGLLDDLHFRRVFGVDH